MLKVIVGDANKDIRFLVKMSLRDYQVNILEVRDGERGLKLVKEHKPDLIIVDYILDKITGYELAEILAENENYKDIPVVIMVREGFDLIEDRRGVDEYIAKPFDKKQFLETINRVIEKDKLHRKKNRQKENIKKKSVRKDDSKKRILAADDEDNILKLLDLILSNKYNLDTVRSGLELVNKAKKSSYDLIISDVVMPKLSGWKSVKKIRAAGIDTPVIFNSGLVKDKELYETLKPEGPSAFILKPFKKQRLLQKVKEMIK